MKPKFLVSLFAAFALVGAALTPAHASSTVLPSGANAGDASDVQVIACPTKVQIWLPVTMADSPISQGDTMYDVFYWTILEPGDVEVASGNWSREWNRGVSELSWVPATELTPGENYSVTASGRGDSDEPVEFTFSFTALDDEFSGSGAGTQEDPYLVTSPEELDEMRCVQDAYWKITRNLDLSEFNGGNWTGFSLGSGVEWTGVIDGNGKTISGANLGHPLQRYVGLFGELQYSTIKDLTLDSMVATGADYVGILASQAENAVTLDSVSVTNSNVYTYGNYAGILLGSCSYGCALKDLEIDGNLNAFQTAFVDHEDLQVKTNNTYRLGGVAGMWNGQTGGFLANSSVSVNIDVRAESNYPDDAVDLAYEYISDGRVAYVGGVFGGSYEDFIASNNRIESNITLETLSTTFAVGGAVGYSEFPMSGSDIIASIDIIAMASDISIREVGGAIGDADDLSMSRSRVHSALTIQNANGSNNSLGIDLPEGEYQLSKIGGVYGEYDDDTADFLNEAHVSVDVFGADYVEQVGGYVGYYDGRMGLNPIELTLSGEVEVDAISTESIGGFAGEIGGAGTISGSSVISAVSMEVTAEASQELGPVVGLINAPSYSNPLNFYWDSRVNDYDNQDGYNFLPATTTQLTDRAFLSAIGFDMSDSWILEGGYPVLNSGIFDDSSNSEIGEPIQIGDTLVFVKGNRDFTSAGGLLELEGEGLRGVALAVNGQPLFVQIITDTSGFVQIPAGLAPGSYTLVATANSGNQSLQGAFRILGDGSNSTMKVWTKRIAGETEAKFYAKNIVGEGKVRFVLNGREIAWVNALDNTDPKLRSANGAYYLVRTVSLKPGKNVLEIYIDSIRERRVVYTR